MHEIKEIFIELSDFCVLACRHCSSSASSNGKKALNINELTGILLQGKDMGVSCVTFSGGEPLLHLNFFAILELCSRLNYQVRLYSSGVLLDGDTLVSISRDVLKNIYAFKNIDAMIFSLHGSNAKTHDYITNTPGSFDLVLKSIKKTYAKGIKTEIHTVPMSINYREIPGIIQLAKRLGVDQLSLLRLVPQGRYHQNKHLIMNADETREFVKIVDGCGWQNVRKGAPFKCLFFGNVASCSAGKDKVLIGPDGSVLPCEAFKAEKASASIKEKSLQQIWRTDSLINRVRNLKAEKISFCNNCPDVHVCSGGCPGQRRSRYNNMMIGPDPICINY